MKTVSDYGDGMGRVWLVVKPQPEWMEPNVAWQTGNGHSGPGWYAHNSDYPEEGALFYRCPYGQPGDRLYPRETWAETDLPDGTPVITLEISCERSESD